MKKENNTSKNIIKMRPRFQFNIGVLIFLIIFVYVMYFIIAYFTEEHVIAYMVESGSLVQEDTYTGLCIREEEVFKSTDSGLVIYYASQGERVGAHTLVYSLDSGGVINSMIDSGEKGQYIKSEDYKKITDLTKAFSLSYNSLDFTSVYSLKSSVNSSLRDSMNANALEALSESGDAVDLNLYYANTDGIVEYYTDGFESVTADNVSVEMLDQSAYSPIQLESNVSIDKGDPVYKLVRNEAWDVVIDVSDETAQLLTEMGTVNVIFLSDHNSAYATATVYDDGTSKLARLTFANSMERYADSRYLDIKLNLDTINGLKIPVSAITEKEFLIVPKDYASKGGDSDETGFLVATDGSSGSDVVFESPDISYESDGYYYIDPEELSKGTTIVKPDSQDTYTLNDTETLSGAYCVNKGYAIFKKVNILYQSSDYAIIEPGIDYGLSQYDYIVLDATKVKEGQIVK